jgi:dihydropteroate synthase
MGIINVTPDSFSDGGRYLDPREACARVDQLLAEGADVVDVGGESTRPGAVRPTQDVELARVIPVISALAAAGGLVSVDTMRPEVAERAVRAGARLINDVSGGRAEPEMLPTVARLGVPYVCMHWRGHATDMQSRASYVDLAAEVTDELAEQVEAALAAGIRRDRLALDPGFGFAKTGEHNWELLNRLDELDTLGFPILYGLSRKAFLGSLLAAPDGTPRPARQRDDASLALTTLLAWRRVWAVRVHRVRPTVDAVAVVERLRQG